jgi:hypothetical protein
MPGLFWAIVALVALLPAPLGGIYQWSWGLMASIVGIVLALWSGRVALGMQDAGFGMRTVWLLGVGFGLVILWILLQAAPFTPAAWHHPLWSTTADVLGEDTYSAISLNPFDTLSGLVRLLAYAGIFWIALQYCRRAARARQVLLAVVYSGLAYAVYGIAIHLMPSNSIPIFSNTANVEDLTSTFLNRNSFATYAGLALVCCTGLLLTLLTQTSMTGVKQRAMRFVEVARGRGWPVLVAWPVLLVALLLSHSRTGLFSTALGLLSLIFVAGLARVADRRLAIALGALCLASLYWVVGVGADQLSARLLENSSTLGERSLVHERILIAIRDAWALGTGFGTFEEAFRFYRTSEIPGSLDMAYSIYLENVLELGIPAASVLFSLFVFFLVLCGIGIYRRRRDAIYPCVGLAATVLISADIFIGTSLHVPAVTATYMLIVGAACAQCWSSRRPVDPW